MNNTVFEEIIVIGSWSIAAGVLKVVDDRKNTYGYRIKYIDNGNALCNPAGMYADSVGIEHIIESEKEKLTEYLYVLDKKTLIISAGNYYIFPSHIIDKHNLTIINFHNSLLPNYPGRNATTWVIYMREEETGITWHYVSKKIDGGAIIYQEKYIINSDEKAYVLVAKLMKLAVDGFEKCFGSVLDESINFVTQDIDEDRRVFYAKDIPQNGIFSLKESADDIYRLLRSLDYGKNSIFPPICFYYDNSNRIVRQYWTSDKREELQENMLMLKLSDNRYLNIKYK